MDESRENSITEQRVIYADAEIFKPTMAFFELVVPS